MSPSPPPPRGGLFSTPQRSNGSPSPAAWWSPSREEKARDGSPVDGVVHQQQSPGTASAQQPQQQQQQVALITLPPPREVARPEMPRDSVLSTGRVDEEEWVTVFGRQPHHPPTLRRASLHAPASTVAFPCQIYSAVEEEGMLRRHDAQKALAKHSQQLNSVLIIGVKQVDPWQRPYLNENTDDTYNGGMSVPFPSQAVAPSGFATRNALAPLPSNPMQNGNESNRGASGAIASPAKSVLSKVMDVMFGL
ncbi:hypothetical protein TRIUR3_11638 [Triticum urartu]|uniref:Uncharacterized protein n=1 Tax=Triticum urartu TaxID=4572 RepID=M7ZCU3_TRIUA|nr:hypothetical protein TRIUR3_11638 [Triticum urartu]